MANRYLVHYRRHGSGYSVVDADAEGRPEVFHSLSKPEAISEAQRLNGFEPVDGDENTYMGQSEARSREEGR